MDQGCILGAFIPPEDVHTGLRMSRKKGITTLRTHTESTGQIDVQNLEVVPACAEKNHQRRNGAII